MTLLQNSAEGGSNGTTVTSGNSGGTSGDAFTSVAIGTGSTLKFSTTQAMHGTLSHEVVTVASQSTYLRWDFTGSNTISARAYFYLSTATTSGTTNIAFVTSAGATVASVQFSGTSKLNFLNTASTVLFSSTAAFPTNSWTRVEAAFEQSSGAWAFAFYVGDSTTPIQSTSGTSTFTGTPARVYVGKITAGASVFTLNVDDIAVDNTTSSLLGPVTTGASYTADGSLPVTASPAGAASRATSIGGSLSATAAVSGDSTRATTIGGSLAVTSATSGDASRNTPAGGSLSVTATLSGAAGRNTNVGGNLAVTASANGDTTVTHGATADGNLPVTSTPAGSASRATSADSTLAVASTSSGSAGRSTFAAGSLPALVTLTGDATTTSGGTLRDVTLRATPLPARFSAARLLTRFHSAPLVDRWSHAPVKKRFTTTPQHKRWSTTPEDQ